MSVTCQVCNSTATMTRVLSLGYMPPPNAMMAGVYEPKAATFLPTEMWYCSECGLAQLGYVPDKRMVFPYFYPYTSGMTPELRHNFEDLAEKVRATIHLEPGDLVVDIGSNDGTLLHCFLPQKVLGVEPTSAAEIAVRNGIPTRQAFFSTDLARRIVAISGQAKVITCTNCFAHMPDIHDVLHGVSDLLAPGGLFVTESHYLIDLIDKLQYDTIYAEHLRYYTIRSLMKLFVSHGLRITNVERIPTHGGSIRVYAQKVLDAVSHYDLFSELWDGEMEQKLGAFAKHVQINKLTLLGHLEFLKKEGAKIVGIGAPSRASTVISYCGLDASIVDYICEQPHSLKVGRYMPGSDIPVVDERRLYEEQPEAAILFSWHLADTLIPKLRKNGYHGQIILPCSVTIVNEPVETVESFRVPPGSGVEVA